MSRRPAPSFQGVTIHRDPRGRFAIRYPTGWQTFEIRSEAPLAGPEWAGAGAGDAPDVAAREGIGIVPDAADRHTLFTAWAAPLAEGVVAEDLAAVEAGVDEALGQLASCQVEAASAIVLGNLIRLERIYTFCERAQAKEPAQVRKRKQWLLYVDKWLICLTWQGADPETYRHWYAMANYSFLTFEIPEALWFFADRERLTQSDRPDHPR